MSLVSRSAAGRYVLRRYRTSHAMDGVYSIAAGLVLRLVVDAATFHNIKLSGTLVGLWEGVVLLHYLNKAPGSTDPYLAYGVRLFVDFLVTESLFKLVIVLLWSTMGMVLADVAPSVWIDSGLKKQWSRVRRDLYRSYRSTRLFSKRRTPTVRFVTAPTTIESSASSVVSMVTTTAAPPPSTTAPPASPTLTSAPTEAPSQRPITIRRSSVPGTFPGTEWSETGTDAGTVIDEEEDEDDEDQETEDDADAIAQNYPTPSTSHVTISRIIPFDPEPSEDSRSAYTNTTFTTFTHNPNTLTATDTFTTTDTFTPNGNSNAYTYPNTSYTFTATGSNTNPSALSTSATTSRSSSPTSAYSLEYSDDPSATNPVDIPSEVEEGDLLVLRSSHYRPRVVEERETTPKQRKLVLPPTPSESLQDWESSNGDDVADEGRDDERDEEDEAEEVPPSPWMPLIPDHLEEAEPLEEWETVDTPQDGSDDAVRERDSPEDTVREHDSPDETVRGAESDRTSIVTIAPASVAEPAADVPTLVPDAPPAPASVQQPQDEPTAVHHTSDHELDPIAELTALSSIPGLVPDMGPLYIRSAEPEPVSGGADGRSADPAAPQGAVTGSTGSEGGEREAVENMHVLVTMPVPEPAPVPAPHVEGGEQAPADGPPLILFDEETAEPASAEPATVLNTVPLPLPPPAQDPSPTAAYANGTPPPSFEDLYGEDGASLQRGYGHASDFGGAYSGSQGQHSPLPPPHAEIPTIPSEDATPAQIPTIPSEDAIPAPAPAFPEPQLIPASDPQPAASAEAEAAAAAEAAPAPADPTPEALAASVKHALTLRKEALELTARIAQLARQRKTSLSDGKLPGSSVSAEAAKEAVLAKLEIERAERELMEVNERAEGAFVGAYNPPTASLYELNTTGLTPPEAVRQTELRLGTLLLTPVPPAGTRAEDLMHDSPNRGALKVIMEQTIKGRMVKKELLNALTENGLSWNEEPSRPNVILVVLPVAAEPPSPVSPTTAATEAAKKEEETGGKAGEDEEEDAREY